MSALIMVEVPQVRPVIGGRWHITYQTSWPAPGSSVTTLCGLSESAEYGPLGSQVVVTTCWDCDLIYRRDAGIPWVADEPHPALRREHER